MLMTSNKFTAYMSDINSRSLIASQAFRRLSRMELFSCRFIVQTDRHVDRAKYSLLLFGEWWLEALQLCTVHRLLSGRCMAQLLFHNSPFSCLSLKVFFSLLYITLAFTSLRTQKLSGKLFLVW